MKQENLKDFQLTICSDTYPASFLAYQFSCGYLIPCSSSQFTELHVMYAITRWLIEGWCLQFCSGSPRAFCGEENYGLYHASKQHRLVIWATPRLSGVIVEYFIYPKLKGEYPPKGVDKLAALQHHICSKKLSSSWVCALLQGTITTSEGSWCSLET